MPPKDRRGLPARPFLYSPEQIAALVDMSERNLYTILFYDGRSTGRAPGSRLIARNIAGEGEKPIWRVSEPELIRWLKVRGFRIYERFVFEK